MLRSILHSWPCMRIEYAHGSREPVAWTDGALRIGSAGDNDVRLEGDGVAGHHVRLVRDRRGLVLEVERGAARVYVNARPVRERTLLRPGDTLGVGAHRLRLCADAVPDAPAVASHDVGTTTATMALRAVAGPLSGRVWALAGRLELGLQGPLVLPGARTLVLTVDGHAVRMDGTALEGNVPVRVNGIAARRATLGDGDQLALGAHRFVLDVSAPPAPRAPWTTPFVEDATRAPAVHREMGWLVATAIVVALVLAWVLWVHL